MEHRGSHWAHQQKGMLHKASNDKAGHKHKSDPGDTQVALTGKCVWKPSGESGKLGLQKKVGL